MRKSALVLAVSLAFVAACGNKENEVEVGKLASTLETYNGQTVTFNGKAVVKESGKFVVFGEDTTAVVFVTADDALMTEVECGKGVKVTGVVTPCEQEVGKYYVAATAITKACCKKDGKKCCKKDSTAAEVDSATLPAETPAAAE